MAPFPRSFAWGRRAGSLAGIGLDIDKIQVSQELANCSVSTRCLQQFSCLMWFPGCHSVTILALFCLYKVVEELQGSCIKLCKEPYWPLQKHLCSAWSWVWHHVNIPGDFRVSWDGKLHLSPLISLIYKCNLGPETKVFNPKSGPMVWNTI